LINTNVVAITPIAGGASSLGIGVTSPQCTIDLVGGSEIGCSDNGILYINYDYTGDVYIGGGGGTVNINAGSGSEVNIGLWNINGDNITDSAGTIQSGLFVCSSHSTLQIMGYCGASCIGATINSVDDPDPFLELYDSELTNVTFQVDNLGSLTCAKGGAKLIPDSGSNGGTCLMLQASDTGTPMYLHVTSLGVATWTTSA